MDTIILEIYEVRFEVYIDAKFVSENIKKDFALYFKKDEKKSASHTLTIRVYKKKPPYERIPPVEASLYNATSICYRKSRVHYVDYMGKGMLKYDFKEEKAELYSEDENLLYEKTRLIILSRMGELLDQRHMHRIHAAGLAKNGVVTLCLLPMAAGKTTIALGALKNNQDIKLVSDDICMVDIKGCVYPFTLRIGVRGRSVIDEMPNDYITEIYRDGHGQKYLIDLDYFRGRMAEKSRLGNILIGKRVFQEHTEIKRLSKIKCIAPFIQSGVFGLGLPQIVELFLRGDFRDILDKISMVFSRCLIFLVIVWRADTYELRIGRNISKSSEELIKFMDLQKRYQ